MHSLTGIIFPLSSLPLFLVSILYSFGGNEESDTRCLELLNWFGRYKYEFLTKYFPLGYKLLKVPV